MNEIIVLTGLTVIIFNCAWEIGRAVMGDGKRKQIKYTKTKSHI